MISTLQVAGWVGRSYHEVARWFGALGFETHGPGFPVQWTADAVALAFMFDRAARSGFQARWLIELGSVTRQVTAANGWRGILTIDGMREVTVEESIVEAARKVRSTGWMFDLERMWLDAAIVEVR